MKKAFRGLIFAAVMAAAAHAAPMFTVIPTGGVVRGLPGSTVGWGFTLTNNTDFLVVTGSSFTSSPLGTYTDFIGSGSNLLVVGPSPESPTITQMFNSAAKTGVGSFHINASAPVGVSIPGTLTIDYSLFSRSPNDPNFNPDTDTLVADAALSQPATVSIVPEPASWLLVCSALPWALLRTRRRK